MQFSHILLVAAGSAIGGALRYGSAEIIHANGNESHFFPTLFVNLIGSLLIGIFFAASEKFSWNHGLQLFTIVGLLGGFTTFSSYSLDILRLFQEGLWQNATIYMVTSVVGGVLLAWAGYTIIS